MSDIYTQIPAIEDLDIHALIAAIEGLGVEARLQHTFFGDEVVVHIYGNNRRAAFYSADQFMRWAPTYIANHAPADAGESQ